MNRVFIDVTDAYPQAVITGDDAKHLQVLRVNTGDVIPASDGKGTLYDATVTRVTKQTYEVTLSDPRPADAECPRRVTLYQALCKGDANEQIIGQTVELGVYRIVFFVSDNCVAKPDGRESAKTERYAKVARLAAMQAGREIIPAADGFLTLDGVLEVCRGTNVLFCYEKAEKRFGEAVKALPDGDISLIIGCEGGFTPEEARKIASAGAEPLSLGKRILRARTAPAAALAVLMAALGEI